MVRYFVLEKGNSEDERRDASRLRCINTHARRYIQRRFILSGESPMNRIPDVVHRPQPISPNEHPDLFSYGTMCAVKLGKRSLW